MVVGDEGGIVGLYSNFSCEIDIGSEIIQIGALVAHVVAARVVIPVFYDCRDRGGVRVILYVLLIVGGENVETAEGKGKV